MTAQLGGRRRRDAAAARREVMVATLRERGGPVSPGEFAAAAGVSVMTVHRDLEILDELGMVRREHGAVHLLPSSVYEQQRTFRLHHMVEHKRAIAARAAALVRPGEVVGVDDSTTALEVVKLLAGVTDVVVATNSRAAMQAAIDAGVKLILFGGNYDADSDAFAGLVCERDVAQVRLDAVFVSASSVRADGAWSNRAPLVAVKQRLLAAAARRYLVVDHSKIGHHALHQVAPLTAFDAVLSDSDMPAQWWHERGGRAHDDVDVVQLSRAG